MKTAEGYKENTGFRTNKLNTNRIVDLMRRQKMHEWLKGEESWKENLKMLRRKEGRIDGYREEQRR